MMFQRPWRQAQWVLVGGAPKWVAFMGALGGFLCNGL